MWELGYDTLQKNHQEGTCLKKVLKIAAIALLAVLAVVLLYVGYVFGTYSRIEDNQALSVTQGSGGVQTAEADTE